MNEWKKDDLINEWINDCKKMNVEWWMNEWMNE